MADTLLSLTRQYDAAWKALDAGVVSFRFRGGGSEEIAGAASLVFERRDGTWEIVHVHESGSADE